MFLYHASLKSLKGEGQGLSLVNLPSSHLEVFFLIQDLFFSTFLPLFLFRLLSIYVMSQNKYCAKNEETCDKIEDQIIIKSKHTENMLFRFNILSRSN